MPEVAISAPFTGEEIIEVACQEFRKRLHGLSPLQLNKEYAGFEIHFNHVVKLFRMGSNSGGQKDSLAWGDVVQGQTHGEAIEQAPQEAHVSVFKSGDSPNDVRLAHDMPLTVESNDGKGNRVRRKVKVKA